MIAPLMLLATHLRFERARQGIDLGLGLALSRGECQGSYRRDYRLDCALAPPQRALSAGTGGRYGRPISVLRGAIAILGLELMVGSETTIARPLEQVAPPPAQFAQADATGPPALADTPEAFTQVLVDWAARHKVRSAAIVVRRQARIVYRARIGGGDPEGRYHLASLSKAVTGACIATLVRDGKLAFETPLSVALSRFFRAHGRPADARIEGITIGQLLTHRGGFSSAEDGGDAATGSSLSAYLAKHAPTEPPRPAFLSAVFASKLIRDPGTRYAYSNAGYLVLGAVIEEATRRSYEDYCRQAALTPAGAAGELEPDWRVMSSYGGWRMQGADYLAFLDQFDPNAARLGVRTREWMLDPTGKTYGTNNYPVWYGPGVRLRDAGRGIEIWHTGSWRRRLPPEGRGPLSQTSVLATRLADGTSWFVHSDPLVLGRARAELDQELVRAHQSVRRWE